MTKVLKKDKTHSISACCFVFQWMKEKSLCYCYSFNVHLMTLKMKKKGKTMTTKSINRYNNNQYLAIQTKRQKGKQLARES